LEREKVKHFFWLKKFMTKKIYTFIILCFSFVLQAQNVSFITSANAEKTDNSQYKTYLGDYFELSFMVINGVGKNFTAPNLKDFNVISGPNAYNVEQITNGNRQSKYGYNYTLQPKKQGRFIIAPAKISVENNILQSNPIVIEVVKDDAPTKTGKNEPIVLRIKTDKNEYFVGEQINLTFQLLSNVNIQSYEITNQPELKDFVVQPIQLLERELSRERYNGKTYQSATLEKKVLFAQKSGKIDIEPIAANMSIETQERMSNGMSIPSEEIIAVQSQPIHLIINDLPLKTSADFSGAVGIWELELKANKTELTTDETLAIELVVKGNGDPKRITTPKLKVSDSLEIYEPKIIEEGIGFDVNGAPLSYKKIEYLIVPKYAGQYDIQAILNYFDTAEKEYTTLKTSPLTITITQGKGVAITDNKKEINTSKSAFWKPKYTTYLLITLAAFIVFSLFYFGIKKSKKVEKTEQSKIENTPIEPIEIAKEKPLFDTKNNIYWAEKNLAKKDFSTFYKNISDALSDKINQRFSIEKNEISEATIASKLTLLGVDETKIQVIKEILHTCNVARFAAKIELQEAQMILEKTKNIIDRL
jgi:hypothetical protein